MPWAIADRGAALTARGGPICLASVFIEEASLFGSA